MRLSYRGTIRYGLAAAPAGQGCYVCGAAHTLARTVSNPEPSTDEVTAGLLKSTPDKSVVACILETKSFDAAGKQIDDSGVGGA
jgi:hypothetical protein